MHLGFNKVRQLFSSFFSPCRYIMGDTWYWMTGDRMNYNHWVNGVPPRKDFSNPCGAMTNGEASYGWSCSTMTITTSSATQVKMTEMHCLTAPWSLSEPQQTSFHPVLQMTYCTSNTLTVL